VIAPVLPTYARAPMAFERGEGAWLVTREGERYLDLGAGIAVTALGHCHPALVAALEEQAGKLWHTSNLYDIPNQQALAERLVAATFADTVFFTNSGTEAIECAIKMARKFTSTRRARRAPDRDLRGLVPRPDDRGDLGGGLGQADRGLRAAAARLRHPALGRPRRAEGGDRAGDGGDPDRAGPGRGRHPAGARSVPARACGRSATRTGILLIFDEIQCGMGRTGRLFAHEWAGVAPDIMAVAKGIGGGFPLGACLATEAAAAGMTVGTHGSTYGGNPLACAVGVAVMDEMTRPGFLDQVSRTAGRLRQGLEGLVASHPRRLRVRARSGPDAGAEMPGPERRGGRRRATRRGC
jgi:acetylornithine/N-succinyldiaminopimelate aminotransferase